MLKVSVDERLFKKFIHSKSFKLWPGMHGFWNIIKDVLSPKHIGDSELRFGVQKTIKQKYGIFIEIHIIKFDYHPHGTHVLFVFQFFLMASFFC